jgi:plastocyanin
VSRIWGRAVAGVLAGMVLASCGGGSGSGSTPAAPDPSRAGITITMTSNGVSPKQLQVSPGTRVLFLNNDSREHEMDSDPHPEHTDCPEINNVGFISPGQTKETGNLNTVRTCGYHDHGNPDNTRFQGSIVIK